MNFSRLTLKETRVVSNLYFRLHKLMTNLSCSLISVRNHLPKFSPSQLTSAKILAQRSAVPAVLSRATSSTPNHKRKITHEEKDRLLRMGKRMRKGPFNAVMDPTEMGAGSALLEVSEAVKASGTYDVWSTPNEDTMAADGIVPGKPVKVKVRCRCSYCGLAYLSDIISRLLLTLILDNKSLSLLFPNLMRDHPTTHP